MTFAAINLAEGKIKVRERRRNGPNSLHLRNLSCLEDSIILLGRGFKEGSQEYSAPIYTDSRQRSENRRRSRRTEATSRKQRVANCAQKYLTHGWQKRSFFIGGRRRRGASIYTPATDTCRAKCTYAYTRDSSFCFRRV